MQQMIFRTIITVSGDPKQVSAVEDLIQGVIKKLGLEDEGFGIYLPFRHVMQVIEGENDYEGNIVYMEHTGDGNLLLKCEEEPRTLYAFTSSLEEFFNIKTDFYEWDA